MKRGNDCFGHMIKYYVFFQAAFTCDNKGRSQQPCCIISPLFYTICSWFPEIGHNRSETEKSARRDSGLQAPLEDENTFFFQCSVILHQCPPVLVLLDDEFDWNQKMTDASGNGWVSADQWDKRMAGPK